MQISDTQIEKIRGLCLLHQVKRMYVFGSQASGRLTDSSDVDLLVSFSSSIQLLDYADNYFSLLEHLEHLTSKKVDLVSASTLKNPVLKASIDQTKKLIYDSENTQVLS